MFNLFKVKLLKLKWSSIFKLYLYSTNNGFFIYLIFKHINQTGNIDKSYYCLNENEKLLKRKRETFKSNLAKSLLHSVYYSAFY